MKTLNAKELMAALRQRVEHEDDGEQPDMSYAEPEPRLEPAEMSRGQS